jgi:hypothetical protein
MPRAATAANIPEENSASPSRVNPAQVNDEPKTQNCRWPTLKACRHSTTPSSNNENQLKVFNSTAETCLPPSQAHANSHPFHLPEARITENQATNNLLPPSSLNRTCTATRACPDEIIDYQYPKPQNETSALPRLKSKADCTTA